LLENCIPLHQLLSAGSPNWDNELHSNRAVTSSAVRAVTAVEETQPQVTDGQAAAGPCITTGGHDPEDFDYEPQGSEDPGTWLPLDDAPEVPYPGCEDTQGEDLCCMNSDTAVCDPLAGSDEEAPPTVSKVPVVFQAPQLQQSCLVPPDMGLALASAHAAGHDTYSGQQECLQSVPTGYAQGLISQEPVQTSTGQSHDSHELGLPEARAHCGLLRGEHVVCPPMTVAQLADADDGQLQTQLVLDTPSLENYLADAGQLSHDIPPAAGADDSSVEGGGIQFAESDDDEGPPVVDNIEGHLMGLLKGGGADAHDDSAQQVGDAYGDSSTEAHTAAIQGPQSHMDGQTLQRVLNMLRARGGQFENGALASARG
jgi:hypothetical protein